MDNENNNVENDKEKISKDEVLNKNEADNEKESDLNKEGHTKDNEKQEKSENKKESKVNKKRIVIIGGIIIVLAVLFYISINVTVSNYENIVYPGVSIYDEDVSKLTKDELINKINDINKDIDKKKVSVISSNNVYILQMKDIVSNYNKEKLVDEVFSYKKDESLFKKYFSILKKDKIDYKLQIELDKNTLNEKVQQIGKETNVACEEPSILINGEKIEYIEGKKGLKVDTKVFIKDVETTFKEENIYKENLKLTCKYIDDNPKTKIDEIQKVNHKISSHSTSYSPGGGRGSNVELAAKKIDNLILMPGDEFSYEKSVGPVTQSNGYKNAPVIANGQLTDGIGGGVCQVSSTLYNTQLKAGILPTERRNHSKAVNYVPRGLDATLASGSIDYKFKNTYNYPIVINTHTGNGILTIEFWSNKDTLNGIEYKPVGYGSGKIANTYLYGYDKNGKKVYEKHIDTSVYR